MIKPTATPKTSPGLVLDGDIVLSEGDVSDLGLEEAPADSGRSWEEIIDERRRRNGHG